MLKRFGFFSPKNRSEARAGHARSAIGGRIWVQTSRSVKKKKKRSRNGNSVFLQFRCRIPRRLMHFASTCAFRCNFFAIRSSRFKLLPHGRPVTSNRLNKSDFKSPLKRVSGYARFVLPHQDVCESRRRQIVTKNGTGTWDRIQYSPQSSRLFLGRFLA